ncbi:unnamed protein product [Larinioides sclopetarius]|uniref:Uncharacterized protein n=1 Tax=Larinioides sclopetarius TaxID=280406 RepID=A0AAV2AKJ2_9ARAC
MEGGKKGDEKKAEGDCEKGGECEKVSKGDTEKEGAPAPTGPAAASSEGERKDSTTESLIQGIVLCDAIFLHSMSISIVAFVRVVLQS